MILKMGDQNITHKENQLRYEEKTDTDDSATDLEDSDWEAIEKSFLFCKNENLDKQDQIEQDNVEGVIQDTEITTNTKNETDQSNNRKDLPVTEFEEEDLGQIEESYVLDINSMIWEGKK